MKRRKANMPDYSKGKIYTIRCRTDDTLIYVGSTTQSLAKRWGGHKVDSRIERCKNMLIYRTINEEWDNWYIELYELYPCDCREQLCKREGEIIRSIGNLNSEIAGRTLKEYREDHKQEISEKAKEKITCECGCLICKKVLKRHLKSKKHLNLINKVQV